MSMLKLEIIRKPEQNCSYRRWVFAELYVGRYAQDTPHVYLVGTLEGME